MALRARLTRRLRNRQPAPQAFAPGAFYSPIVDTRQVFGSPDAARVWPSTPADPPGIGVRADAQLRLLAALGAHRFDPDLSRPLPPYDPANDQFPRHDAAVLYAMVRHLRPARMIEVGCGWSTTVTLAAMHDGELDTELTCVEPHPRPFLLDLGGRATLRQERVECTPMGLFAGLQRGDVLFIDSSHVAKTGSDVNHLLLEVLPRLADGVVIHVHDIFLPEDYPKGWVRAGFNWNEQYLLQAYLAGNDRAHVLAMNHWQALRHPDAVTAAFGPMELNGSSVWFVTGRDGELASEPGA